MRYWEIVGVGCYQLIINLQEPITKLDRFEQSVGHLDVQRDPSMGSGRRVLVTGAGGFIGKALCRELPLWGFQIVEAIRTVGVAADGKETVRTVSIGNADENTDWSFALQDAYCVVHLLARVHVMDEHSFNPLEEYRRVNVLLTMNLARQAIAAGVRRFVFISSIKVNGERTLPGRPFSPEDIPQPQDSYGISKWEAEQALMNLAKGTGMEVVVIRPPLVYGPGVKANFLTMMQWVNKGLPLPFGGLDNKRSLVAIDNLVNLIVTCTHHPAAANHVFMVSDGVDMSVTELIRLIAAKMGKKISLINVGKKILALLVVFTKSDQVADRLVSSLQVDIRKNKILLGWSPPFLNVDAVQQTVEDFLRPPNSGKSS